MKAWIHILLWYVALALQDVAGQQPVYLEAGEKGNGVLKARQGECFVITPAHVIKNVNRPFQIRALRNVLSVGEIQGTYEPDLAIVRITEKRNQACEDWNVDPNYSNILTQSLDGFIEIAQVNGTPKSMKVSLLEKDNNYITVRPYNDLFIKGMSGASLFTFANGKKIYLGMLTAIDNPSTGIVLRASVMEIVLSDYFSGATVQLAGNPAFGSSKSKEPAFEVAVITTKRNSMDAYELAQKASEVLTKQYPHYSFAPYEKGELLRNKVVCEISELTENDPENRIDRQIYKYKTRVVLTVRNRGQLISLETLTGGGTDYSKETAQVLSVMRTLELTEKLKFEKH